MTDRGVVDADRVGARRAATQHAGRLQQDVGGEARGPDHAALPGARSATRRRPGRLLAAELIEAIPLSEGRSHRVAKIL